MRKLLSILLLAVFGLPVVSPLFALSAGSASKLPACCRRNGAHKCEGMNGGQASSATSGEKLLRAPVVHCPYQSSAPIAPHSETLAIQSTSLSLLANAHSSIASLFGQNTTVRYREVSHHKRGPPSTTLL